MQSNYQNNINNALKELHDTKSISSALLVCNTLLEYMGTSTKNVEDIELSKLKLPNAERYDRWFDAHPHFRGDRACFDLTPDESTLEAKFFALQKRSKLFIAGAVNFTPNFEDRDYTRNDPNMKVGIDFFFTPEKDSVIVVLSNKGSLRLVELSGRLTNTQTDIFSLWHKVSEITDKNIFHATIWESFKLSSLNKKFYEGIANSFLSLTQHLQKHDVEEQLSNQFANRLHGRLLFLWFLRKKSIINESKEYFTLGDKTDTEYYANTLSTLFFNVLNNEDHKEFDPITPYLNGGLFDQNSDGEYWNKNKPTFPTGFFRTLYDHFDSFNFTTDESTPEYEQIAIDPEMLGRIFESFLATLTTETGAQAKKANGAFYTPREIVSYMSRESLRQYLYTALDAGTTLKTSIDDLLDRPDSEWALAGTNSKRDTVAKEDRERILEALRNIKVLDPAVGSGAFPMGVLHKILSLFERLEPNFDSYETKLSILKNNIYGVDIDPTAIEISRLRAWLSIIVDVKDIKKIKPLPNLDFKFVCANSLLSLDSGEGNIFKDIEADVINQLSILFGSYYNESKKKAKEKIKNDIGTILQHSKVFLQAGSSFKKAFETYNPFNTSNVAQFYNPKIMHGVEAFDVVIGNPPYVNIRKLGKEIKSVYQELYSSASGQYDLYVLFIEKSLSLLKENGHMAMITPNKFLISSYGKSIRKLIAEKTILKDFVDHSRDNTFDGVGVYPVVFLLKNQLNNIKISEDYNLLKVFNLEEKDTIIDKLDNVEKTLIDYCFIKEAIHTGNIREKLIVKEKINPNSFPLLMGKDCNRYTISWKGLYVNYDYKVQKDQGEYASLIDKKYFLGEKIFLREIALRPTATYDSEGYFCLNKAYVVCLKNENDNLKYILGLLNSKLIAYFFEKKYGDLRVGGGYLQFKKQFTSKIPIIIRDDSFCESITKLVNKILSIKRDDSKSNTKDLEDEIDTLVYKLYDLNEEEIKIVEGEK